MRKFVVFGLLALVLILGIGLYVAKYEVLPEVISVVTETKNVTVGTDKVFIKLKSVDKFDVEFEDKERYKVSIESAEGERATSYLVTITTSFGREKRFQFEIEESLKKALLVVDIQNQYATVAFRKEIIDRTNTLIDLARAKDVPVVFVRNIPAKNRGGEYGFALVSDLHYEEGDKLVDKTTGSAFYKTDLKDYLDENDVRQVVLTGLASDQCYSSTGISAIKEGYQVMIVGDAHSNFSSKPKQVIEDINKMFEKNENAEIVNTADIDFD